MAELDTSFRADPDPLWLPAAPTQPRADFVALSAARALLRAESRREAADILRSAVVALGGSVVPAQEDRPDALPVDVSLGVGEPLVVVPTDPESSSLLVQALPGLVEDALTAAARCDSHAHQKWRASMDELTGVASRREIRPRLRNAQPGDAVCLLDVDDFKQVNDTGGHAAGDTVLEDLGRLLLQSVRAIDFVGRYGGDEFVVVIADTRLPIAARRLRHISEAWSRKRATPTISAGVAAVDECGGVVALSAADQLLYAAKQRGGNRVESTPRNKEAS